MISMLVLKIQNLELYLGSWDHSQSVDLLKHPLQSEVNMWIFWPFIFAQLPLSQWSPKLIDIHKWCPKSCKSDGRALDQLSSKANHKPPAPTLALGLLEMGTKHSIMWPWVVD